MSALAPVLWKWTLNEFFRSLFTRADMISIVDAASAAEGNRDLHSPNLPLSNCYLQRPAISWIPLAEINLFGEGFHCIFLPTEIEPRQTALLRSARFVSNPS